jgi:stage II sporulation protein P
MKRTFFTFNVGRGSERLRSLLVTGKSFAVLSLCSMLFFVLIGIAGTVHRQSSASPISSMKGLAAAVSSAFFADMLGMELPAFEGGGSDESLSKQQIGAFLVRMLTDINPNDPKSLLAGAMPGMNGNDSILLRGGKGTDAAVGPEDHEPIEGSGGDHHNGGDTGDASEGPDGEPPDEVEPDEPDKNGAGPEQPDKQSTGGRKVVFIYHTHNRESWYPELGGNTKDPNSSTKNITLVGKRLAKKLEEYGVGALHSDTDYPTTIPDYRWELLYKYSMKTVKEAMAANSDLTFFFDIHRDANRRKHTTVTINGKDYAQVYFIIGHRNPHWRENEKFAARIHDAIEQKYPGISRGIWGKTAASGNAEYNQSLSSNSVLIEIGGVDNTLEESYRTADALAQVIADLYWDAEKVDAAARN